MKTATCRVCGVDGGDLCLAHTKAWMKSAEYRRAQATGRERADTAVMDFINRVRAEETHGRTP